MKVFAQLIFLFPIYQTWVNETAAVCHHQGRHSAEKRAAKQWTRLYTCHLQPAVSWASCVCAYTVPMPYPVCNTEPHCTTYHLQPCFVIWMQKASATTQTFGGASVCTLLGCTDSPYSRTQGFFFFLRHLFANNRPKQFEVFPVREVLLKELCHFDFSYTLGSALRFVNSYLPSPMPQAPDLEHSPVPILVTADEEKVSHDSRAEHCHFQPLEALWDLLVHQANIGLRASSGATATSSSIIPAVNLSGEAPLRDRTAELQGAVLPTGSWGLLLAPHQQTGASENHLSQEHRVLAHTPNLLPSHYLLGVIVSFPNS